MQVALDNGGSEQIEKCLSIVKGRAGMVIAAAQRHRGVPVVVNARLDHRDIVPSKARAIVGAKQGLVRTRIRNRLDLPVLNAFGVEQHSSLRVDLDRSAARKVGGDIESSLLRE